MLVGGHPSPCVNRASRDQAVTRRGALSRTVQERTCLGGAGRPQGLRVLEDETAGLLVRLGWPADVARALGGQVVGIQGW